MNYQLSQKPKLSEHSEFNYVIIIIYQKLNKLCNHYSNTPPYVWAQTLP